MTNTFNSIESNENMKVSLLNNLKRKSVSQDKKALVQPKLLGNT
jgi:hypothetical protein